MFSINKEKYTINISEMHPVYVLYKEKPFKYFQKSVTIYTVPYYIFKIHIELFTMNVY